MVYGQASDHLLENRPVNDDLDLLGAYIHRPLCRTSHLRSRPLHQASHTAAAPTSRFNSPGRRAVKRLERLRPCLSQPISDMHHWTNFMAS